MNSLRLVLADDHQLVRAGIRLLLEQVPGVTIVGEADDGTHALELVQSHGPDILLTDIAMRGLGGLALAAQVARDHPQTRVIILSMHAQEEYVVDALRVGAAGYLLKDAAAAELERALQTVQRGETYLSPALSQRAIDAYVGRTQPAESLADPLTPRQRETLRLLAGGKNTKEIAAELGVSVKTIETHRAQLMDRLGIHDVPGLVKYALRHGIIPPEA